MDEKLLDDIDHILFTNFVAYTSPPPLSPPVITKPKPERDCINKLFWFCFLCILINLTILTSIVVFVYPQFFDFYERYSREQYYIKNTNISLLEDTYHLFVDFPRCRIDVYQSYNIVDVYSKQQFIITYNTSPYTVWYKNDDCFVGVPHSLTYGIIMVFLTLFGGTFLISLLVKVETFIYKRCIYIK